jgi:hypothetical protein
LVRQYLPISQRQFCRACACRSPSPIWCSTGLIAASKRSNAVRQLGSVHDSSTGAHDAIQVAPAAGTAHGEGRPVPGSAQRPCVAQFSAFSRKRSDCLTATSLDNGHVQPLTNCQSSG